MAIDVYNETGDLVAAAPMPAGARALGVRVKPILRLAMGHKNEKGYPVKDDHFSPRGDDRAVAKFLAEYGDNAKSIEILLPSELDVALTIQYRAFKGGQNGEGGTLVAIGHTNFALRDYCGGPDLVTVFNQDGTVEEVETGLDANTREPLDAQAKELGLELYTTLTAMMPGVLGFGSHFALTTKGKESTDNLWLKLRQLYGLFGSKITFAVKPQLVIRSSTARPVVKKDGETKRITTTIYVADIVVPETIDEMIGRLQERQAALAPSGATSALYGEPRPALASVPAVEPAPADVREADQQAPAADAPSAAGAPGDDQIEDGEFEVVDESPLGEITAAEFAAAASTKFSGGAWDKKTFAQVAEAGEDGHTYLFVQLKKAAIDKGVGRKLAVFVHEQLPDVWQKYVDAKAAQS